MSKLFRTGGTNPMAEHYEEDVELEYDGIDSDVLNTMLAAELDPPAASQPARDWAPSSASTITKGHVDFDRIRREHPIEEIASRLLDGYRQRGPTTSVAACPVHGDSAAHPNLHIRHGPHPRSGTWICSSCKAHGDVMDLVKAAMGLQSARQALDFLDGGQQIPEERRAELARRAEENARRAANVPLLNRDLNDFAREAYGHLRGTPGVAREYLARRGLERAIGRYGLGFVPRNFNASLLPRGWDYEKEEAYADSRFYSRIIIPYRLSDGTVPLVNARDLLDRKPKYLKPSAGGVAPGGNARPYLFEQAVASDGVIAITEGEFDAMSLGLSAGDLVREVAIPGVNCFTERDAEALAGRRVLLITDNDAAGRRASGPLRTLIEAYADSVQVLCTPGAHKDVNDLMLAEGPQAVRDWIEGALKPKNAIRFV